MHKRISVWLAAGLGALAQMFPLAAADAPPNPLSLSISNDGVKVLRWPLMHSLDAYRLRSGADLSSLFSVPGGIMKDATGYSWTTTNTLPQQFYSLELWPMSSNAVLSANLLNRLAYGPTPDDLERLAVIGPQAYIDEQLAPESIPDTYDAYVSVVTNAVNLPPNTNWTFVTVTGSVSSSTLYMYLTGVGEVYLDDVQLRYSYRLTAVTNSGGIITTNVYDIVTDNALVNGDFEQPLTTGWTVSANHATSYINNAVVCSGTGALRMRATAPGTTQGSSIWQNAVAAPTTMRGTNTATGDIYTNTVSTLRAILSFAYLPSAESRLLTMRLSGSGTIISAMNEPEAPAWVYATTTGTATGTPAIYIYLSGAGEAWVDDIKLVAGTVPEAGPNLQQNGGFDSTLAPWQASADFANSVTDNTVARSGSGSLKVVATAAGGGSGDSVFQSNIAGLANGQTYTVSYWYRPSRNRTLTVRLSGSQLLSTPDLTAGGLRRRLENNAAWGVSLDEMRRWFCLNGAESPRQLLEILTQFLENHFVTYHSKTADYFDRYYDGGILNNIATDLEYREVSRWRNALLNPNCTFYDLLEISAESPAQIIYLDTVTSRGDGTRIANENYARELFELYCMGVDNGYDQNDIVAMSRAWTGWTVDIVAPEDIDNPHAARSRQYGFYPGAGFNAVSNIVGVWTFVYNPNWHGTNRAPILSTWNPNSPATNPVAIGPKTIPARFGPPWAGRPYQLAIPPRTGTSGIQDGYDVIRHLADLPFTAEYISIKLCRLFIHDDFPNPTTIPDLPEYAYYDYTNPNRTPEAELIRQCIVAWDTPGPDGRKGNIRSVLRTIFDSELFRGQAAVNQKVKTPLEFVLSAVRALRSRDPNGTATAFTDGNFSSPLSRMGQMSLFNRADPDGYPESGPPWISAGTLAERLRFVQTLCMTGTRPSDAGNNTVNPVALLKKKLTSSTWNNPFVVADFFLGMLYPGEGKANLEHYRAAAVDFLNTADDGVTSSPFSGLSNTSTTYDTRVRGMVAMLMTLQRFQEQ